MKFQKPEHEQPSYLSQRYAWRRPALPLHKDILLYPRVSTTMQLDNISAELQTKEDGELIRIAHKLGWLYEYEWQPGCGKGKIRAFPQDMAVSGRLRMEERAGFKLMLQAIISGEAGAVLCIEVDRLFRDKYGQESGKFMEICEKYGVIVITPRQIYDFRNNSDVSDFKEDVARAWDYMQRQVYDKMIYAQEFLSETGRIGRGQRISIGYILDIDRKSPTFRHLIPYPPHAEIKRNLYVRYRELGNSMGRLYRELKARPFVFPDFPDDFPPRHAQAINLIKVPGGWTVSSLSGLTRMMCDVCNIGWMRHRNDVVRNEDGTPKVCHEPIVPEEEFWYVFKRYARHLPSGELNPETKRWREGRREEPVDAMLRPVLESVEPTRYHVVATRQKEDSRRTSDGYYAFYNPKDASKKGTNPVYAYVGAPEVDRIFWQLLLARLEKTTQEELDRYIKREEDAAIRKEREHNEILAQIEACNSAIAKQQAKLLKVDRDELIEAINEEVRRLAEEKVRLQKRLQEFLTGDTKYAEQVKEWSQLLISNAEDLRAARRRAIEDKQQLASVMAPKVTLELLSPRVLRMIVHWRIPDWKCEEAVWISETSHGQMWTDDDRARLVEMVGNVSALELMQAFPSRSWRALHRQALLKGLLGRLPVVGPLSTERGDWHDTLCWNDWPHVQEYQLDPTELHTATITCTNKTLRHPGLQLT